jgi:hypothetical protein
VKRLRWVVILSGIALLCAGVLYPIWWLNSGAEGEQRTLAWPSSGAKGSLGPIAIDLSPDLAANGVSCEYLGISFDHRQRLFFRSEMISVELKLSTGTAPLGEKSFRYALIDQDGNSISFGTFQLEQSLGANESTKVTIRDLGLTETKRIAIRRR